MRTSGFLWRALAAARRANLAAAGAPPPIAASGGITRRKLLGALAASATLPAMGCKPLHDVDNAHVAIIGGGLAGLVALRDLRAAGVDAKLYEARGRLGGRISTYRGGPVPADDGGQFINSDHADVIALAKQYKLKLIDRKATPDNSLVIDKGRLVTEAELAQDLRPIAAQIAADAEATEADEAALAALDALSVAQYLDRHANKLPKPYVRALMEATIRTEYGQEPGEASAVVLIWNLPTVDGNQVEIIGSSDERYVIEGGSGSLISAMIGELTPHIEIGQVLTDVHKAGERLRLRFAGGRVVEAERAIVTVPAPLLRTVDFGNLLPELWRRYVAEIDCGRNEKLNAAYDGRPWRQAIGVGGDVWPLPGGFSEVWDAGTTPSETGLLTWYMGGAQCAAAAKQDAASLRRAFEAQAAPAIPGLDEANMLWQRRTRWNQDKFSRGAYSCFRPGQLTRYAGLFWLEEEGKATQMSVVGNLAFAGEHVSDAWPGYMNGAAQTGRLAARAVLGR